MKDQDDIQGWMVASLTNKWAVDQLINNAITIHLGSKVIEYIKLSDDTYVSPPGITTQLVDNGDNTFSLRERFGTNTVRHVYCLNIFLQCYRQATEITVNLFYRQKFWFIV
ncbi:MAG: hypothetical protein U9O82_11460 [Thermodesulfobacteriota bacterium]|nr:hypothetical protein [Thermodesulfobacteriota bacterium]